MISLDKHCWRLSQFIISQLPYEPTIKTQKYAPNLSSNTAYDWLNTASAIQSVCVNYGGFDLCSIYCSPVAEYEDARSELTENMFTELLRFNFIWGAFETTLKLYKIPKIPKTIKPRSSIIDQTAHFIKNKFEFKIIPIYKYKTIQNQLFVSLTESNMFFLNDEIKINGPMGYSGLGLYLVKNVRNQFAHGLTNIPEPPNWENGKNDALNIIVLSSRIVLFSIQLIHMAFRNGKIWSETWIPDLDHLGSADEDLNWDVLSIIHRNVKEPSEYSWFNL